MAGAPLITVVIPVFQVEAYLADCLDSILAGAGDGVEVIAVEDRSPDSCGRMLDDYAQRDPRVQVVHLATNVGLGRARNAGLARARGEYVWFVDSDDWLPDGALAAVTARLRATRPDVLIVDHVEVSVDGRSSRAGWPAAVDPAAPPAPLERRPDLLRLPLSTSACTKVVRRDLLTRSGLRFPPGWYEDVAYAYPLLLAAERVDVLERVCYCYRRRDGGAITRSVSAHHFDVFEQYARMWAWLDRAGTGEALRPEIFRLMIDHLLVIAGNDRRVPPALRRAFFRQVAVEYRRRMPPRGYRPPGGAGGVRHRLVSRDAYPAYAVLRLAWRMGRRGRRPAPVGAPQRYQPVAGTRLR
jgi:CDP-glycerol glycerophosphotransferase